MGLDVRMDNEFATLLTRDFARSGNRRLLSWQDDGISVIAFAEHRPSAFPPDYMLINFHLWLDNTRGGGPSTGHAKKKFADGS